MVPTPVAFKVTDEPCTLSPRAILPPLLACRKTKPLATIGPPPATVMLPGAPLSTTVKAAPLDGADMVTATVSVTPTEPVVLATRLGELRAFRLITPEPDDKIVVPAVVTVPPVCMIVPDVVASSVTDEPETLAARAMLPPLLACRVTNPEAVIGALTEIIPAVALSVTVKAAPVEAPDMLTVLESVTLTAPVVLATRFGEFKPPSVIAPLPDESIAVPGVVTVPADSEIVPPVVAFSVILAPAIFAASAMLPPLLACRVNKPPAVIAALTVMLPGVALSVIVTVPPLDVPDTVTALTSVTATVPVVLKIKLGELRAPTVIPPVPVDSVVVPVPVAVTVPAV
jgi:hypothetical protein